MNKHALQAAFPLTIPVMAGYLVLGMGFGILLESKGFGFWWAGLMSLTIYAGSMQYVAIGLLSSGAGLLTAAMTTFLVNARHLFYGISMVDAYKGAGKKKPYLIFALTDETYSLVTHIPQGVNRHGYCLLVSVLDQLYWVVGSVVGSLAGSLLPVNLEGIDFVLTALFVTILVEQWLTTQNHIPALTGLGVTAVCLLLFGPQIFLIPSMLAIAALLTILGKTGRRENHA